MSKLNSTFEEPNMVRSGRLALCEVLGIDEGCTYDRIVKYIELMMESNNQLRADLDESSTEFKNAMRLVKDKNDQISQLEVEKDELVVRLAQMVSALKLISSEFGFTYPLEDIIDGYDEAVDLLDKIQ